VSKGLRLLLVRHAETEWNRAGRYQGCIDTRLSPIGREQARLLAQRLMSIQVDAVYTSPLARAVETAEAIAHSHGLPIVQDPAFSEICHGEWEGLTVEEVEARFPDQVIMRRVHPERVTMPNGESLAQVRDRALQGLARVEANHTEGRVCIIMHDAPLKMLLLHVMGLGPESFWRLAMASTGLSTVKVQQLRRLIHSINDVSHLAGHLALAPHRAV
jgi:broad specificity phosphatase PhoE